MWLEGVVVGVVGCRSWWVLANAWRVSPVGCPLVSPKGL